VSLHRDNLAALELRALCKISKSDWSHSDAVACSMSEKQDSESDEAWEFLFLGVLIEFEEILGELDEAIYVYV
jgi:hypothetical protein